MRRDTVLSSLLGTFVYGLASGVIPLVSAEAYLIGIQIAGSGAPWLLGAALAAITNTIGKLVYYLGGNGMMRLPHDLLDDSGGRRQRLVVNRLCRWGGALLDRTHGHPRKTDAVLFVSAITGLPPFTVTVIVAGAAGMSIPRFVAVAGVGRTVRFGLIAGLSTMAW